MSKELYEVSGSPAEIEKQLEAIRQEMAQTVNDLSDRVKPAALAEGAKAAANEKVANVKATVNSTVEGAKAGDRVAQRNLAIAGAATVAVVGLIAWRIFR
ncbi:hypothetical protein BK816_00770 [Boudabousia tangfeifanii]|uniref:DUF3618 domain-containing protein n=1 Tax=Boudabousia tangfeifanii TaxID=1912795 RepID=A0A1D9MIH2_9ACTO|nr:DUF3618 domain-containing protein [Boudabousia tangfeifanii]AOZ72008.1 hypothetical protein BK816_00770 [Boudabousia tangfeifanii]